MCAGLHSAPVSRSFDKEIDETTAAVVVMFLPGASKDRMRLRREFRGRGSGSLSRSREKNGLELTEKLAHLRARDDEWGQEAQGELVGAVDEQAALQGLLDKRRAVDGEFDADHETLATNLADEGKFGGEGGEAVVQFFAARADVGEEIFFVNNFEKFEGGGGGERTAAESRPVKTGRDFVGDGLRREDGTERKAGRQRLGDENDVGLTRELLISEVAAGAAEAALNFVGDEERAVFGSKSAGSVPEILGDGIDAAFALNGLKEDGTDSIVEFRFEVVDIIEADEIDARDKRREGESVFFGGSGADGAVSAAMKGISEREDAVLPRGSAERVGFGTSAKAGELYGAVDSFGAAVGEEDAIHAGPGSEFARERALELVVEEVGEVNGASGFATNSLDDAGMSVAQGIDGDAAEKVEIFLTARVEDVAAAAMREEDRLTLISREHEMLGVAQRRMVIRTATRAFGRFMRVRHFSGLRWRGSH